MAKIDLEKLADEVRSKMKNAGARDHSLYVNTLLKIQQQLESQSEGKWWKDLRDLRDACESIEELQFGEEEKYKLVFENEEKKKIFLAL